MRYIFLIATIISLGFSNILEINSFEADFKQVVTNDAQNKLTYEGHVSAIKPQSALWIYTKPTQKQIYIDSSRATIIEPDIEQVIIKHISTSFDFFNMLSNAKKVQDNIYVATFQNIKYKIELQNNNIHSITYTDELENQVVITFSHQVKNKKINKELFIPIIPMGFDIIEG